ncbi:hypothetical protein TWF106_006971 [Orbilia oligospora]|uniref:Uncharacterized protein n=1 Tax=Orbilia oligospora TaxID=2813651 RepID=A0A6G1M0B8_ORBOL|nr:hypothetical protein TWF788_003717 [Orbilia oligospora]KAF3193548.1 hypothetical protein TWF106_006971 [Orbilia oligospora]KAF3198899.1 hypothetical protein TWF191_004644 [Orbilia oligospora]KAF3239703.1 hypothetical protein TWF192_009938 [Orbilia oligospora]
MLRLSGSQILLTNRDVTRTLNPKRTRRPPTYLYTKGKQPIRNPPHLPPSIPHINTSRPSVPSPSTLIAGQSDGIPPQLPAPVRPSSPDWSTSSDTEISSSASSSSSSDTNMAEQSAPTPSTDGADDEISTTYLREVRPFRQVVSLETIDSFPFLPYRPPPSLMFDIYEDPIYRIQSPVDASRALDPYDDWDPQPFPYLGSSYYQEAYADDSYANDEDLENADENAWAGEDEDVAGDQNGDVEEDEDDEEVIILNEAFWDPDTILVAEMQAANNGALRITVERIGTPPAQ